MEVEVREAAKALDCLDEKLAIWGETQDINRRDRRIAIRRPRRWYGNIDGDL